MSEHAKIASLATLLEKTAGVADLARMAASGAVAKEVGVKTPGTMMLERIREGGPVTPKPPKKETPEEIAAREDQERLKKELEALTKKSSVILRRATKALTDKERRKLLTKRYPKYGKGLSTTERHKALRGIKKKAGVAKKTMTVDGLQMKLEYLCGDTRFKGRPHERKVKDHYGYMPGTFGKGADGECIDVYVNPKLEKGMLIGKVYKVKQLKKGTGEYDEDKFMVGYGSAHAAKGAFMRNMPNWAFGGMTSMAPDAFRKLVGQGDT